MNRGRDYEGGGGGSRYGGNKRSYDDDNSHYGGNDGYKRSRHEGGGYQRPYNNNGGDSYRNGGGRDDRRYGGGYNNNSNYDRRRDNGPAPESEQARAWRLTKKGIVELGENSATPGTFDDVHGHTLRDQLVDVAGKIKKELDGDRNDVKSSMITALVVRCVGRLSHKTSLYAVLVGLVNEKQSAFGRSVVDAVVKALQQDLDFFSTGETTGNEEDELRKSNNVEGVAQRTRLFVRFLGELVSTRVVKGEDMLSVLDTLQGLCTPDDFNSDSDDRSTSLRERENGAAFKDFFASVVLDTLLQVGVALSVNNEDIYDSLLSRCKEYISNREEESNPRGINDPSVQSANWLERRLRLDLLWEPENDGDDLVAACKKCDLLTQQWEALNLIRAEANTMADGDVNPHLRWKLPGVVYPQELFEKNFIEVQPHALTTAISVDFNSLDHSKIPRYEAVFRIFGEDSGAIGAPLTNLHLASYLTVRGHLGDVIEAFYPKPAAAAKHLLGVTRSYNVRFAQADIANLKTEYVLLESLLVKALNEKHVARLGYLCSVLTHLVKVDARLLSPAFAIVVELLFREIPLMNAGAVDAFVKLFSHFLSNFEYKWMWARWAHVLEASEDDAQRLFVSSVIERCVRLSYLQHMQTALPAEFHGLLPPAPKPRVIYQAEDESTVSTTSKEFFQAVSAKLKSHPPANALNAWLEEELNSGANIDRQLAIDIVFTAILDAGAATFTHSRLMLEKYGAIGDLFRGEQAELQLVKTVGFVWVNSPQHIGLILNMMLRQRIVLASTIAKWIFTTDAVQQYSWPYVWGILDETLTFLVVEIDTAKRAVLARTSGGDADMNDGNDSVSRLEEELQDLLKLVFGGFNRVITEYKANCESDGVSYKDNWFLSALAQLKAVGAKYRVVIESISESIIDEVFSGGRVDPDAKKVFEFVRDSYSNH